MNAGVHTNDHGAHCSANGHPVEDLQWTGNHFIGKDLVAKIVSEQALTLDFTRRASPDSAPLREAIAAYYQLDPGSVAVGVGSSQLLDAVLDFLPVRQVFEIVPNFPLLRKSAVRRRLAYKALPVRFPSDLAAAAAQAAHSDALLVLSSPRNPQGYAFPHEDLTALIAHFPGYLLVDEAYADFSRTSVVDCLTHSPRLFVLRTFSKAWGLANLRIGYLLSLSVKPDFWAQLLPYNVGELSQRVACSLLSDPAPIDSAIEQTRVARAKLITHLQRLPGAHVWPSDSNFVCVEFPSAARIAAALQSRGFGVTQLQALPDYPQDWPAGLRIAATPPHSQDRLARALTCATAGGP